MCFRHLRQLKKLISPGVITATFILPVVGWASHGSPTLEGAASDLVNDVLNRNTQKLAKLVQDECPANSLATEGNIECINGMNRYTYDYLYTDENNFSSVSSLLKAFSSNMALEIEYFNLADSNYGPGSQFARVYFFDKSKMEIVLPLTEEIRNRWMKDFVTCLFVKIDDYWYVAYTLFESETDGP